LCGRFFPCHNSDGDALYARLAISILAQRRERESRMMTMEALAASIAHELNQPLAAVVGNGGAGLRWLDRPVPDLSEARASLQRVVRDGHRAAEAIESIRSLFRVTNQERSPTFINAVILEVLELSQEPNCGRNTFMLSLTWLRTCQ